MPETEESFRMLKECLDGNPVPTFVLNADHCIVHWNRACETILGKSAQEMVGTCLHWSVLYPASATPRPTLADLVLDGMDEKEASKWYGDRVRRSEVIAYAYEATEYFPHVQPDGRWLLFTASPIHDLQGNRVGAIETLVDITAMKRTETQLIQTDHALEKEIEQQTLQLDKVKKELEQDIDQRKLIEAELKERNIHLMELNTQLTQLNERLSAANDQIKANYYHLIQKEKMASLGQLSAGIAHEINNPMSYVFSNFRTLDYYFLNIINMINRYIKAEDYIANELVRSELKDFRVKMDLESVCQDIHIVMQETGEGIERVVRIIKSLKDFSHGETATAEWQRVDVLRCLSSTLNIVHNQIKYLADVVTEFSPLPAIQCLPFELNQVFMNLLINAAHAMENRPRGLITLRSGHAGEMIWIEVEDTGSGMSEEIQRRLFEPFFTTKPVGKGTGLGLSLSYGIVQKHHGLIEVRSQEGVGTCFRVSLPVCQPDVKQENSGVSGILDGANTHD